jgi:hemolysin activation/secretion protein
VLRHELLLPALRIGASAALRPTLALEWGRIHDPIDGGQTGRELAALALGLRWQAGRVSGQLTAQQPLRAPPTPGAGVAPARRDARLQASLRFSL